MSTERETPETDKVAFGSPDETITEDLLLCARKLERERDEAREMAKELAEASRIVLDADKAACAALAAVGMPVTEECMKITNPLIEALAKYDAAKS